MMKNQSPLEQLSGSCSSSSLAISEAINQANLFLMNGALNAEPQK